MRLSPAQQHLLKTAIQQIDSEARVFLFGSRTDDSKTGGDIDVLILSKTLNNNMLRPVKWQFYDAFGEQKIDIIIDSGDLQSPFVQLIFPTAIEL